jgi:hypothetical protein
MSARRRRSSDSENQEFLDKRDLTECASLEK